MNKFLDRLERINSGTTTPLGFGSVNLPKTAEMALVALVSGNYAAGMKAQAKLSPDATLFSGADGPPSMKDMGRWVGEKIPWGVRVSSLSEADAGSYESGGCTLLAFGLEGTSVAAVASDDIARVLCIDPGIDSTQLRIIGALPVDVLLLSMNHLAGPWTLQDLAVVADVCSRVNKYILVEVPQPPGAKDLEALRNLGVHGLVLDVGEVGAKGLSDLHAALLDMPRQRSRRRERTTALIPGSAFSVPDEPEQGGEEPEEDE